MVAALCRCFRLKKLWLRISLKRRKASRSLDPDRKVAADEVLFCPLVRNCGNICSDTKIRFTALHLPSEPTAEQILSLSHAILTMTMTADAVEHNIGDATFNR
jgi:hypothetical protein